MLPTRKNLLDAKVKLDLANKGFELLDKKHKILTKELMYIRHNSKLTKSQLCEAIKIAKSLSKKINMENINKLIPLDFSYTIDHRYVMGAAIPTITNQVMAYTAPVYPLATTCVALDEAFLAWQHAKQLICKLAESETAIRQITVQLQKAKKRANALKEIIIPALDKGIKYIREQLEERERDELTRVKVTKKEP